MNKRITILTKDGPREADLRDDGAYWADNGSKFLHVDSVGRDVRAALRDAGHEIASDEVEEG